MNSSAFKKRVFTFGSLLRSSGYLLVMLPWLIHAYVFRGLSRRLAEQLFVMISGVNGCVYCTWFHSRMALRQGVDAEEVSQLLQQLIPHSMDDFEQPVLLFALHFAESAARPDPRQVRLLQRYYSPRQIRGILALCHAIYFGNLSGNTFDAFLSRLKGNAAENSHPLTELLVFLFTAPFLLPLIGRV